MGIVFRFSDGVRGVYEHYDKNGNGQTWVWDIGSLLGKRRFGKNKPGELRDAAAPAQVFKYHGNKTSGFSYNKNQVNMISFFMPYLTPVAGMYKSRRRPIAASIACR